MSCSQQPGRLQYFMGSSSLDMLPDGMRATKKKVNTKEDATLPRLKLAKTDTVEEYLMGKQWVMSWASSRPRFVY